MDQQHIGQDNDAMIEECNRLEEENARLKQWIADMQNGMYVNCVYCGHRYGPADKTPVSHAEMLKQHVLQCPEHPMSKLKQALLKFAECPDWQRFLHDADCVDPGYDDDPEGSLCKCEGPNRVKIVEKALEIIGRE